MVESKSDYYGKVADDDVWSKSITIYGGFYQDSSMKIIERKMRHAETIRQ